MTLGEYIRAAASLRYQWGRADCCTFPAGWIEHQTGRNPMAAADYSTEAEAYKMIFEAGGLVELWQAWLKGFAIPSDPVAGAIGVVQFPAGPLGGVFTGERWAFLCEKGISAVTLPPERVLASWVVHG